MDRSKHLSIIIPNRKEKRIAEMVEQTRALFPDAQIIVSNDDTGQGKGITLQRGLWYAQRDFVVFINGDMDIHPSNINRLLDHINYYDIVIGIKKTDHLPLLRKLISNLSRWLIRTMFRLPISDTQTGIKVFKRYALHNWDTKGYGFDIEILADAHRRGYQIKEVEVTCESTKSKGLKDLFKTLKEVIALKLR